MTNYTVYTIKLAIGKDINYSGLVINAKYKTIDTAILSFLIVGPGILAVVDTGYIVDFYEKYYENEFTLVGNPEEEYKNFFQTHGFKFEDVTHIILTHLHWDHVQCNYLFPNAKIYVQREEIQACAAPVYNLYYIKEDLIQLMKDSDRLVVLDGDEEIADGLKVVLAGGHTLGSQLVYVNTSEGLVVITGDVCNIYENLEVPSKKDIDRYSWARAVRKIKKDADIVLPSHDLKILEQHAVIGK